MSEDQFTEFKKAQREGWTHFTPVETHTTPPAGHLIRFAGIRTGDVLLDVGTGTGVAAVTARRAGAKVTGIDLTPELLVRAKENAALAECSDISFLEGDAEKLPFPDAHFDVVISQFGHMFAPRPEVATQEMLRVLKPGGRIAFATWPPEHFVGQMFSLVSRHVPPPPGVAPPPQWGDPREVRQRLGDKVENIRFERGVMRFPALSAQHYRAHMERTLGPVIKLIQRLKDDVQKLSAFRREFETLVGDYLLDNVVQQDYLLTRARKLS